jgi:DNA (cytosine-5)-methyltransferase 1
MYHWDEPRSLTIAELKRVSGFPDDFILTGSFNKQWERIGRAVPPVMMSHVASTVRSKILDLI